MVAICIKYCYVLLINLYYIPDPPFLLHAILETALTHLRNPPSPKKKQRQSRCVSLYLSNNMVYENKDICNDKTWG